MEALSEQHCPNYMLSLTLFYKWTDILEQSSTSEQFLS